MLLRFVQAMGSLRSGREQKEAREVLRRAGVIAFLDRLPSMVLAARNPVAAYRYWCETMKFRDETRKSGSPSPGPKTISRKEPTSPVPVTFGLPEAARAQLARLKSQFSASRGQNTSSKVGGGKAEGPKARAPKVSLKPPSKKIQSKPKKKRGKRAKSKAASNDVFSKMRRLPGSAFSNQR